LLIGWKRYKRAGAVATDENGTPDTIESINISRDDILAWPEIAHRTYPTAVNARMESTIVPFMHKSLEINKVLIDALNDKLGLPKGALSSRHSLEEHTSSEIRAIKAPKNQHLSNIKLSLDAHSDYGTIVCLIVIEYSSWIDMPDFRHSFITECLEVYKYYYPVRKNGNMSG
jgi:hypothetical protein